MPPGSTKALAEQQAAGAEGKPSRWEAFHFRSQDNPHISQEALKEISQDMSNLSYRQEILAEDVEDTPGALWTRILIENARVHDVPQLIRVAVGVDPPGGAGECGIVVAGVGLCMCKGTKERHAFERPEPEGWSGQVGERSRRWLQNLPGRSSVRREELRWRHGRVHDPNRGFVHLLQVCDRQPGEGRTGGANLCAL